MERVTRAEAARALSIDRSTLTRWTQKHPALVGEDGLVDLADLRAHRDSVVNPKLQTRGRAAQGHSDLLAPAQAAQTSSLPQLNDHRARGEYAKSVNAELDLAERLKLTFVRSDVEEQVAAAGDILKRKASEIAKDRAEQLARIEDPRQMERALEEVLRQLLDQGASALIQAMATNAETNSDAA